MEQRAQVSDALRGLVRELLAAIDARLHDLTSRADSPNLIGRQCAAGGLARARALLGGIVLLVDGERDDVAGVLLRTLYETYVVSLHLLLGGVEAAVDVTGDYVRSARILAEKHGRPSSSSVILWNALREAEKGPPVARLKYDQIAGKVGEALERARDPRGGKVRAMALYDTLYRVESQMNSHGGLGSIGRYVDWQSKPLRARARPTHLNAEDRVVLGALMTAHLAAHVFRAFGLRADAVESLWERLDTLPETQS